MHLNQLSEELENELLSIRSTTINVIKQSELSIVLCRNLLSNFKKQIYKNDFKNVTSEISFFKTTKQTPLFNLVYHSELRAIEIQFPKGNQEMQKKYVQKKIGKLNRFFMQNIDFIQYIEQDKTYLDDRYFTREFFNEFNITHSRYYFRDPDFSSSHDLLLAKLKANKHLITYLEIRFQNIGENNTTFNELTVNALKWTGTKTELTELIYALYHKKVINKGDAELKEIASTLERAFNFETGDIYKIFSEIRIRKKSRTKFLDDMSIGLLG